MKTQMVGHLGVLVAVVWMSGARVSPGQQFVLELEDVNLNPTTFVITARFTTVSNYTYALAAYDGPPVDDPVYTLVSPCFYAFSNSLDVQDTSGALWTNGRTYRGFMPANECSLSGSDSFYNVFSVNEVYLPYPWVTNPSITIAESTNNPAALHLSFGEGIYSNHLEVSGDAGARFFRWTAPNGNPSNAVLQAIDQVGPSGWHNVP